MANGLMAQGPEGAEFLFCTVVALVAAAVESAALAPVPVPLELSVVVDAREDVEDDGLGQGFLYTNCSGSPLHVEADEGVYVPFGYIQQVPSEYGVLSSLCGLKTT